MTGTFKIEDSEGNTLAEGENKLVSEGKDFTINYDGASMVKGLFVTGPWPTDEHGEPMPISIDVPNTDPRQDQG